MPTAAVVIIGNEILTGKFADENAPFLIRRLRELGVDLLRVCVIPDIVPVIVEEVRRASALADHVFTTGGVGPTHDDVTMAAIAAAFEVPLHRHPALVAVIEPRVRKMLADDTSAGGPAGEAGTLDAALRMADVPEGAELWWDGGVRFPLVVVRNVAIFPGVPALLQLKFEAVAARFAGVPKGTAKIWTLLAEPAIADVVTEAANRWPAVDIGSYPRFELTPPRTLLTLESRDPDALRDCDAWLRAAFPTCAPP